jgi:hypothetical protein
MPTQGLLTGMNDGKILDRVIAGNAIHVLKRLEKKELQAAVVVENDEADVVEYLPDSFLWNTEAEYPYEPHEPRRFDLFQRYPVTRVIWIEIKVAVARCVDDGFDDRCLADKLHEVVVIVHIKKVVDRACEQQAVADAPSRFQVFIKI